MDYYNQFDVLKRYYEIIRIFFIFIDAYVVNTFFEQQCQSKSMILKLFLGLIAVE